MNGVIEEPEAAGRRGCGGLSDRAARDACRSGAARIWEPLVTFS